MADRRAAARSASLACALACALLTASRRRPHTSGVQLAPSEAEKAFDGLARAAAAAHVAGALARAVERHRGEQRRALAAHQRLGLRVVGHRRGDVLVRHLHAAGQVVERGVGEQLPPFAAVQRVGRRGRQPAFGGLLLFPVAAGKAVVGCS
jgi:hypothetical protein